MVCVTGGGTAVATTVAAATLATRAPRVAGQAAGRTGWWRIVQGTLQTTTITPHVVSDDSGWRVRGRGHFNDDFFPDLLWRNDDTGANGVWLMNGTGLRSGVGYLPTIAPSTGWDIVDSGS